MKAESFMGHDPTAGTALGEHVSEFFLGKAGVLVGVQAQQL